MVNREAKFKRALMVHFLTHFTKNFCRFLTPKVKSGTDSHQSKTLIFYFGIKKFGVGFLKILWETDKVHFTSSNLVCVYTHPKFQNMKFSLSVFDKIFKNPTQNFFYVKNRKSEFSIDGWIISVPLLTFGVKKRQKFFVKWVKKCTLSALLNFASLNPIHFCNICTIVQFSNYHNVLNFVENNRD